MLLLLLLMYILEILIPFPKPLLLLMISSESISHLVYNQSKVNKYNKYLCIDILKSKLVSQFWVTNPLSEDKEVESATIYNELIHIFHKVKKW